MAVSSSRPNATNLIQPGSSGATPLRHFGDAISCLPAYLALFVAIGAGCYTLNYALSLSGISAYLWYALIINLLISFGLQCGSPGVQRFCRWARVISLIFLPLCTLLLNATVTGLLDSEAAINEMVALFIGAITVFSILAIGASFASHTVPIAAPLVPGLSFFGLLNSLSVNTVTQVCFIIFIAAGIYLISYERMLTRSHRQLLDQHARDPRRHATVVGRTAVKYLAACSVWFCLFLAASAVLYYPMETILPQIISDPWTRNRRNRGAAATDWRGSTDIVRLKGGYIALSDTIMMQVSLKGVPPTLWRGRVYERYSGSTWEVTEKTIEQYRLVASDENRIKAPEPELSFSLPPRSKALVRDGDVVNALIEPEDAPFKNLFFPGRPIAMSTNNDIRWINVDTDGVVTLTPGYRSLVWPYSIQARLEEESPSALLTAPGLTPEALKQWREDEITATTLEVLPDRQTARAKIQAIAADIQQKARAAGRPLVTPYEKGVAVRDFLNSGYTYSLASPPVPMNEDAVVFFLTDSRQGACDMFASSAVMLLRAMDVPARLATGYLATETTQTEPTPAPAGGEGKSTTVITRFPLRERDAHAWVEYYIPRAGWLTMDPTEGTRTTEIPLQTQIAQLLRLPRLAISGQMLVLPVAGVLLLLVGMLWPKLSRRNFATDADTPEDVDRKRITEAYDRAVRLLTRHVPHRTHYTPQEYEAAVTASTLPVAAQQEFAGLTYLAVAARYATVPPRVAQTELDTSLQRLQNGLK